MNKIYKNCDTIKFKKTPVIPAVFVCLARKFNEAVAMDLMDFREMVVIFLIWLTCSFVLPKQNGSNPKIQKS